jgi:SAM-dependent methyltransferase
MGGAVTRAAHDAGADVVVWHELECGGYTADLDLWLELADAADGPVLEIGAGSGRVTLELARAGHEVVALDREPQLLAALREHARGLPVDTVCADARDFALERRFALCLVPMQTVQLLGGKAGRARFLRCARAHLDPGALLAAALLPPTFEQFEAANGEAPDPEVLTRGGVRYSSQPTALRIERSSIVIERLRERRARGGAASAAADIVTLDRVTAGELELEASALGFTPEPARAVAATSEHVGSEVVMLRA